MRRIAILGAGAFGTGLAIALARGGAEVALIARNPDHAAEIQATRRNERRLQGADLPDSVSVSAEFSDFSVMDAILFAVPMQSLSGVLSAAEGYLGTAPLVACCKGIDLTTLRGATALLAKARPGGVHAVLTGPSFAADIAKGLPTALTLAATDDDGSHEVQHCLSTPVLRLYRTDDVIGAELGGALKNVIAIAAGATIGAGLGDSARAALMTRGYAEMVRLATALGARAETLAGLSGFGDLVLTCTSDQSRNFRYGLALGRNQRFDQDVTVEGVATAKAAIQLAENHRIEMPITALVAALADGKIGIGDAMDQLLARPLRRE